MHEVGIMESALDAVRREARTQRACRVERIVLRVGAISGVEPESLRFAFDALARDTIAADARLDIECVPARVHCRACARDFTARRGYLFRCPLCGDLSGEIRAGRELELSRIEFT
jgi:hydrogenase nickel incorporation protein HypA/HybF